MQKTRDEAFFKLCQNISLRSMMRYQNIILAGNMPIYIWSTFISNFFCFGLRNRDSGSLAILETFLRNQFLKRNKIPHGEPIPKEELIPFVEMIPQVVLS